MRREVVASLMSHLVPGLAAPSASTWRLLKEIREHEIPDFARSELSAVEASAVLARLARLDEFDSILEHLREGGIGFLTEFDADYPRAWLYRLGDRSPSHLFVAGETSLLNASMVGIVGSREVDEPVAEVALQSARVAVSLGHGVVSGGARGVDEIAMRATLDAGGSALGILAEPLSRSIARWDVAFGRVCLASPFGPDTGFQVANAMSRNKLIYASSVSTVVISSGLETGGTWAGAVEALRSGVSPVLVWIPEDAPEGNRALAAKGARPIRNLDELAAALADPKSAQGSLFG
jgi:predicted Rossmann fold nucleotide-binding protein DprA/Smf involved in DNA uptake